MQIPIADMLKRRSLRTRNIKVLILDEADEMLNKGFKEQIYDIYRHLPPSTQVCYYHRYAPPPPPTHTHTHTHHTHTQVVLVSATLPHDILEMTKKFMTDPISILVKR